MPFFNTDHPSVTHSHNRLIHTHASIRTPIHTCIRYWKAPLQNLSLPTYIRAAGLTTGLFGKELNVNDDTYVSPGWDRFFALGGTSEGHYYADWFNDQGKRYVATDDEYMTCLLYTSPSPRDRG